MTHCLKTGSLIVLGALLMSAPYAMAQTQTAPAQKAPIATSKEPIEIDASQTIEWLRTDKKYVARGNVEVKQGTMTLYGDTVTADYREDKTSSMQIWQLTATGNVRIVSEGNTAYSDNAVYNIDQGLAILTGKDLKIVSPDQTVTATDRMEYYTNTREAKAIGNAKVVRIKDTLTADVISAFFVDQAQTSDKPAAPSAEKSGNPLSSGSLDRLEAEGNVMIVTPTEKLYGDKGIYNSKTNMAEITGNVKIERGPNVLQGARADVDLTTNVSRMFGDNTGKTRVRGVFFPGSKELQKEDAKTPDAAKSSAPQPSTL